MTTCIQVHGAKNKMTWLFLLASAAPCAKYALRTVPPPLTQDVSAGPESVVAHCLAEFLSFCTVLPPLGLARTQLALQHGGLGLRSAVRHSKAAYWACWADSLRALAQREPVVTALTASAPLPPALSLFADLMSPWLLLVLINGAARVAHRQSPIQPDDDPGIDMTRVQSMLLATGPRGATLTPLPLPCPCICGAPHSARADSSVLSVRLCRCPLPPRSAAAAAGRTSLAIMSAMTGGPPCRSTSLSPYP